MNNSTKNCIAFYLLLFTSILGFSQSPIHKDFTSDRLSVNGGSFYYKSEFKYQLTDCGYGNDPSALNIGFTNTQITEIIYADKNATELLNDVSYPISAKFQAYVSGSVVLRKGNLSYTASFSQAMVSNTSFQTACFSDTDKKAIKNLFGDDITHMQLMASLKTLNVSQQAAVQSKPSAIIDRMRNKLVEIESKERDEQIAEEKRKRKEAAAEAKAEEEKRSASQTSNTYSSNSSTSSSYSSSRSSSNSETAQQKRDREYQERKRAFEKEQLEKLNRSTQTYNQRQANLTNAGNNLLNAIDRVSQQASENRSRQAAIEEQQYQQLKAEREAEKARKEFEWKEAQLKKKRELEEKKAKEAHKEFIIDSQRNFGDNLQNQKIPVQVPTSEVYFYMVDSSMYPGKITFAPFKVKANSNMQIPYRSDLLEDFYKKTGKYGYKIYGPYYSKYDQDNAIAAMEKKANDIEMTRQKDILYVYVNKYQSSSKLNTDFWGNKKTTKSSTKPNQPTSKKKKQSSFWD